MAALSTQHRTDTLATRLQAVEQERDRLAAQLACSEEMRRTLEQELIVTQREQAAMREELRYLNQLLSERHTAPSRPRVRCPRVVLLP